VHRHKAKEKEKKRKEKKTMMEEKSSATPIRGILKKGSEIKMAINKPTFIEGESNNSKDVSPSSSAPSTSSINSTKTKTTNKKKEKIVEGRDGLVKPSGVPKPAIVKEKNSDSDSDSSDEPGEEQLRKEQRLSISSISSLSSTANYRHSHQLQPRKVKQTPEALSPRPQQQNDEEEFIKTEEFDKEKCCVS